MIILVLKNKTILYIFFLFVCNLQTQKITLTGTAKDILQNPLSYANVLSKPKEVSKNSQFAITDNEGYYKLLLNKNVNLKIDKQIKRKFDC